MSASNGEWGHARVHALASEAHLRSGCARQASACVAKKTPAVTRFVQGQLQLHLERSAGGGEPPSGEALRLAMPMAMAAGSLCTKAQPAGRSLHQLAKRSSSCRAGAARHGSVRRG